MFSYYLELALRSLRRSPGLTALMVLAIGFGVAASMTSWSVFRAVSGDPIPWKSSRLFVPQIDNWGPNGRSSDGEPPNAMDYADAMALMRDHRAKRQSAMYQISPSVVPAQAGKHPLNVSGHAVYSEFFPMLDVPFKYGSGWSASDDQGRAPVVVISSKLNQKLFGGASSVGKTVNIEGKDYRVVGVLDEWNPQPRFYDVVNTGGFSVNGDDVFLPFLTAIQAGLSNDGNTNCNAVPKESGFVGLQHSECVWIAFMAELDAGAEAAYRDYLEGYARDQQRAGRFAWAPNGRLRDLRSWLDNQHVVPSDTKVSLLVALGLLLVCLVNTVGLLLAKFLRRSSEIGVRRALGAPRAAIYAQFITEAGIVGLAGGVLGLLLTGVGVASVGWVLPRDIAALARVDVSLLLLTLLVAVVATMLAGLYPTFRASRVQPAWQLKSN
ncbi:MULTISPECIES: ABC transporter permease [Rhodanobacter]|uniref:ABC transporter permease n=1 Tax=Rhodanobacter TaxID=75309 RepID=UPI0003FC4B4B|nr:MULTISPECIES: ABC transporter permease [Rhodanobacter]KZC21307.1 peptide ABC transporter permease [Rhodanobacter denitrificans]UJJ51874.1 ABC transporter permease [Rhodanobacter denitrificans]UJM94618.1 ABC transporter permease [Rhodanobacter denitrificans]UJM98148.1 ABC transporter permease [Rhodanobacter denitrificans]UJN22438.1 ABC transporter permease [Rhodanobacter denitrificans]